MSAFGQVWRNARLRAPGAPPLLVRDWVRETYNEALEERKWSFLRGIVDLSVSDGRSADTTVTQASATITSAGLAFIASDVGRQFRLAGGPIYTIVAVAAPNATLDRVYSGTSGVITGTIRDHYVTMPSDFAFARFVGDYTNQWWLNIDTSDAQINYWDPVRTNTGGDPRCLVPATFSPVAGLTDRIRYELWPATDSARQWTMLYQKKVDVPTDATTLMGVLANRDDVLMEGVLAKVARWPGTTAAKNPYFNLNIAMQHQERFEQKLARLEVQDEDVYMTWVNQFPYTYAPFGDARWLQSHEGEPAVMVGGYGG